MMNTMRGLKKIHHIPQDWTQNMYFCQKNFSWNVRSKGQNRIKAIVMRLLVSTRGSFSTRYILLNYLHHSSLSYHCFCDMIQYTRWQARFKVFVVYKLANLQLVGSMWVCCTLAYAFSWLIMMEKRWTFYLSCSSSPNMQFLLLSFMLSSSVILLLLLPLFSFLILFSLYSQQFSSHLLFLQPSKTFNMLTSNSIRIICIIAGLFLMVISRASCIIYG